MYDILKNKFLEYVSQFDQNDERIRLKIEHTFRVVEIMDYLSQQLNISQEDRELARIIALFHDIGRFEQVRTYHTFVDSESIDHADFGCQIIREQGFFSEKEDIIVCAIHNHNKLCIEPGLDAHTLLMCKLIRDADKCDIFRVFVSQDYPTLFGLTKEQIESSFVSEKVKQALMEHRCVVKEDRSRGVDYCLTLIGFFYDLYFDESISYLMKDRLYKIPFENLHFTQEKTRTDIQEIFIELENYIQKRMQ